MGSGLLCKQCKLATDFQSTLTALSMLHLELELELYRQLDSIRNEVIRARQSLLPASQLRIMVLIMA